MQYIFKEEMDLSKYRYLVIDYYRTGDFDENSSKRVFERTMAVSGESTIHSTYNYWESDTLDERMERAERAGKEAFEIFPFNYKLKYESDHHNAHKNDPNYQFHYLYRYI